MTPTSIVASMVGGHTAAAQVLTIFKEFYAKAAEATAPFQQQSKALEISALDRASGVVITKVPAVSETMKSVCLA